MIINSLLQAYDQMHDKALIYPGDWVEVIKFKPVKRQHNAVNIDEKPYFRNIQIGDKIQVKEILNLELSYEICLDMDPRMLLQDVIKTQPPNTKNFKFTCNKCEQEVYVCPHFNCTPRSIGHHKDGRKRNCGKQYIRLDDCTKNYF